MSKSVEIFLLTLCTFECIISEKERRETMSDINENILLKIYEEVKDTKEQLKVLPEIKMQVAKIPIMEKQLEIIMTKEIPEIKEQVAKIPIIEKQLEEIPKMKKQLEEIPKIKKQLEKIPLIEKQLEEIPKIKKQLEKIPLIEKQLEEIPKIKKQLEEIPKMKKQLEEIPKMKKQLEEIPKMKKQLEEIPGMKEQIAIIPKILLEIQDMKQEIRRISGSVARIEVEHGEKLVALFDAFKVNSEKIEEQNKRIAKCEEQITEQGNQIFIINSKIGNL